MIKKNNKTIITLNGIETNNKGAELMLYAILQEIERKFPDAIIYLPLGAYQKNLSYIKSALNIRNIPFVSIRRFIIKSKIYGVLKLLGMEPSFIMANNFIKEVDYFLDASGFAISDQWNPTRSTIKSWKVLAKKYGKGNSKMIFLPQAFGPIKKKETKKIINLLNEYSDLIIARERESEKILINANVNKTKIRRYPDFTNLVKGVINEKFIHLNNGICIIPNSRMFEKGAISKDNYIKIIKFIIDTVKEFNHPVYILNHEGPSDEKLAYEIASLYPDVVVVTGLNALEVKGVISTSYVCISSRFHGVVSALNSCVPCLATSWSHKYEELYKDYDLKDLMLKINDFTAMKNQLLNICNPEINLKIRNYLKIKNDDFLQLTKKMWEEIWNR